MKKFWAYMASLYVASNLYGWGARGIWVPILMLAVMLLPAALTGRLLFKVMRFNYIPTPFQIVRGFSKLWPAINKGPVVTRVHRRQSSPTP